MSELINIENGKIRLELHIDAAEYEKAIESAYRRTAARYSVPGFRKGKVPRKIIEKSYGADVFWGDEFDDAIQRTYSAALQEHGIIPELQPNISITSVSETDGVSFFAEVVLRPEVTLGQYKGIEVEKNEYNVTDEMINAELDKRRESLSRIVTVVDRAVQSGDTANIDFAGFLGDEQFEGGTAKGHDLKIGSGSFIPGFEDQVIGMHVNDDRDITVTFPEDYQAEHLAGKEVVFKVKLNSITISELPELNDAFAQDSSEFESLSELTEHIRAELIKKAEEESENALVSKVIETVVGNATVDVHEDIINAEVDAQIERFSEQLKSFGADLNGYLQYAGISNEDMRKDYFDGAKRNLVSQYVLLKIIEEESIAPTDDNYISAIKRSPECKKENWSDERIEKELNERRSAYASNALYDATVGMLVSNAIIK